jgi:hypothetical protein
MARMIQLDPAPCVALPNDWQFIATEAGRYSAGLTASVQAVNGAVQEYASVPLAQPAKRTAFAARVAQRVGVPSETVDHALLELLNAIEGMLRTGEAQATEEHQSQATRLVDLVTTAGAQLFHTPEGDGYATIEVESHKETWPLKVKGFRRWLARLFYEQEDKAPGAQAVQDALGVLEGKALYDGPELPVYTRLAEVNGAIYLDLGDPAWQAVEITPSGWQVVATPPVKFRRAKGLLPLPVPAVGGSLEALQPFVNLAREEDWRLVVSWLLAALRPVGPYPVLVVYGEQGSAKTTLVRVLRALIDSNTAASRTTPRDERDLAIAATNGWLIALDNLSHLPDWLSDALCRLATGSGFATRELYTDADETIFAAQRPIVLNGIEEVATRGDLLDRAITLYLPTIPDDQRKDEKEFWQEFARARPQILGALLDSVSSALQRLPSTTLVRKPRMADFALWACAAAEACGWTAQEFLAAYQGVRDAVHELTLEASPVGPLVRDFATRPEQWKGTATELLGELELLAEEKTKQQKTWPKNGRALSNVLRRLAPTLRAVGVDVEQTREPHTGKRLIVVTSGGTQVPGPTSTPQRPGRVQGTI